MIPSKYMPEKLELDKTAQPFFLDIRPGIPLYPVKNPQSYPFVSDKDLQKTQAPNP